VSLETKRKQLKETTTLAIATTVEITNLLRDRTVPEIAQQLRLAMPNVTTQFATVAAIVSANEYNEARALARTTTAYKATPKVPDTNPAIQSAIGFGMAQLTKGTDYDVFQSTLAGNVQRLTLGGDRETIDFNVSSDPSATLYERVPSANSCAFCLTMAAVAEVQRSSEFDGYHAFCNCQLQPVFTGQERYEGPEYKTAREAYALAEKELDRRREEVGYSSLKRREASAKYPDLAFTTPNKLRLVREITGWK
jgi:hypothetical protein